MKGAAGEHNQSNRDYPPPRGKNPESIVESVATDAREVRLYPLGAWLGSAGVCHCMSHEKAELGSSVNRRLSADRRTGVGELVLLGSARRSGAPETSKTRVVCLITQKSQVQILPRISLSYNRRLSCDEARNGDSILVVWSRCGQRFERAILQARQSGYTIRSGRYRSACISGLGTMTPPRYEGG